VTRRDAGRGALVLLGYTAVAFAYFGYRLVSHPGRDLIGYGRDPQIFVWSFAWMLHAIETWQNPFYSHAIYAPTGINLAWATSVPGLALLYSPVTAIFGPDVSYNLAAMLAPALSAFTAYLLCRHVTRSTWAALVGGYLFGFSSYMLGEEEGHLHVTSVFLVPLIALAALRYLRGEIEGRGLGWRLGVLFGLQLWISTEVLVTAALALAVGLVLAAALLPATRPRIRTIWRPLAGAVGLTVLIGAPLVYYLATGFQSGSINIPSIFDGDLLNFLLPTRFVWAGGQWFLSTSEHFQGNNAEAGAYLGIPTLVIVIWFAFSARRSAATRFLLAGLGLAALLTLGTALVVKSHREFWLPWDEVARLPIFDNVLPARFALYGALAAAVIVAVWTSGRRGVAHWLLPALAVAALVPDLSRADYVVHPERWAFFTAGTYKACVPKNENLLILPFGAQDNSTLWQAESNFWFRIPEGYLAPAPPARFMDGDPLVEQSEGAYYNPTIPQILAFVHRKKVDRVASVIIYQPPTGEQMHSFGVLYGGGGMYVAPGCGYPSLQTGIHPTPPHPAHHQG
jgi:hypothetical protein